ncbi:MAG: hypothetical protein ACK5VE_03615 [Alphaproteobacteria bacterium]
MNISTPSERGRAVARAMTVEAARTATATGQTIKQRAKKKVEALPRSPNPPVPNPAVFGAIGA